MPLHIACMYHTAHLHSKLFILAHELVDREPENPVSWYAVGVWYLASGKWPQARQYFRCEMIATMFDIDLHLLSIAKHPSWTLALDQLGSHLHIRLH